MKHDLIVSPNTERQLEYFLASPSHALILIGPTGSGKLSIARVIARNLLNTKLEQHPYLKTITPENKATGITAVRELEQFLARKVPGKQKINRIIIIENAHVLQVEAQNALLKTLEEPPEGTLLILTARHEQALLPTIRSRAQAISITKPARHALQQHFVAFDTTTFGQAYAVSGGLPGLIHALLNQTDHPLNNATEKARQLLSQSNYERLLAVDELSKQRILAIDVSFILQQMAHISLQSAGGSAADKWQKILTAAHQATELLENSAQPKLVLTNLMLSL